MGIFIIATDIMLNYAIKVFEQVQDCHNMKQKASTVCTHTCSKLNVSIITISNENVLLHNVSHIAV